MQLDVMTTYRLHLTPDEFSTLGRALAKSDDSKARQLNVEIQRMRMKQVELSTEKCQAAMKAAEEANNE
jgi:hypothetical protein